MLAKLVAGEEHGHVGPLPGRRIEGLLGRSERRDRVTSETTARF